VSPVVSLDVKPVKGRMNALEAIHCVTFEIRLFFCEDQSTATQKSFLKSPPSSRPVSWLPNEKGLLA